MSFTAKPRNMTPLNVLLEEEYKFNFKVVVQGMGNAIRLLKNITI